MKSSISIKQIESENMEVADKRRSSWRSASAKYYEKNKEELQKKKLAYYHKTKILKKPKKLSLGETLGGSLEECFAETIIIIND